MSGSMFPGNAPTSKVVPPAGSAGHSSESEGEEDTNVPSTAPWSASSASSQPQQAPVPMQKRRRVTRACDECRRKKIKCDGKQPCTHCTVYSYDCTYDQPSNRRRNPAPQYIEALETRLQRAETLLKTALPNVDLNDPNIDALVQQARQAGYAKDNTSSGPKSSENMSPIEEEANLRSMIESTGQLDLDESGYWDFHGGSSGAVFMGRMREEFGGLLGRPHGSPFLPRLPRPMPLGPIYDSPRSNADSPMDIGLPNLVDLPPREIARALCVNSLECACSLMRFIHQPTFYEMFDRVYDLPPDMFGDAENRFLPLLYVILALGCMFHIEPDEDESTATTYKSGIDQGLKYFRSARSMMDITDCRDITTLQAILFMVLFLQSSSNLSTCYSYIGIALRASLRMGLHRNLAGTFNPIERETRRRVFWIVRKMDTYVSALLGFPHMLRDDDIDQEMPLEIDDEYITKDGIRPMPLGVTSLYAASNAHTRLMDILAKVVQYIYPTKNNTEKSVKGTTAIPYMISHAKIREIERDLADWLDKLPMALRPGGDGSPEVFRCQQLLRLAYAHVQMMLYRPFLHYVSQRASASKKPADDRSYACAAAGRGVLIGAFWFTMYTTFFAIISLIFFVLENPDKPGSQEILKDAIDGQQALKGLAKGSQAADRCSIALESLFEQLPERLIAGQMGSGKSNKKRSAPSPPHPPAPRSTKSASDFSQDDAPEMGISRARTFPMPAPVRSYSIARTSIDDNSIQSGAILNPAPIRQSFYELRQPNTPSSVGTPDSSSTNTSVHQAQFSAQFPPPNPSHHGLPDLSAMMFPSADPFAYPNQPPMSFDSVKREEFGHMGGGSSQGPPIFLSHGTPGPVYDDLEGQLFGPIPPYLMQGQPPFDIAGQVEEHTPMAGLHPPEVHYHSGLTPTGELSFDIFGGEGEDWNNMMQDPRFR
ncbi:fungal-specific transcription factor domain-containing protein [Bisporella sp. PMI_857]|nr:fungal-specific transcription factor domain-containing protein [Bisporella sp. PMI_857]